MNMKIVGNGTANYSYGAGSPSDPLNGLGFDSFEGATSFATRMNEDILPKFDDGITWNIDYWKVKPLPWVVWKI